METLTSNDWLQGAYFIMDQSFSWGSKIYPLFYGFQILRILSYL